jgi:hypothetical protein
MIKDPKFIVCHIVNYFVYALIKQNSMAKSYYKKHDSKRLNINEKALLETVRQVSEIVSSFDYAIGIYEE